MKSEIKKVIEKELKKYEAKEIKISDKKHPLYLIPELCDEELNIFEGFLYTQAENKSEVSYLKNRYKPPVSGYAPRVGFIFYNGHLLIKDYRRNKHIIKTIKKINKTFLNKLKKALSEPKEENLEKLFDRTDVIEEFYILYKKAREYLLKNIKGIPEEEKREEFVDNFMMQMLTLWYLQERGFFNNDKNYFITKFKDLKQKKLFNEFKSYYEFLIYLFEKISGYEDRQYVEDLKIGKVVVIGPAVFLNGEHTRAISIPDKCFYKEGMTDILINTPPKKVSQEVPLLNLFESRDWTEGNIDEFVLGAIYEKLITYMERKKLGAYYTPEEITSYICENTIKPYLVDKVNESFEEKFKTIDQIIESSDKEIISCLFEKLKEIKILDPAVGSAHFLESAINVLVEIYEKIWNKAKEIGIRKGLEIVATNEKGEIKRINLLEISDEDEFKLLIKFFIILSKNIYGVDINPSALKVAKARLFLTLAKHFKIGKEKDIFIRFPNVHFNLREGNSLIGYAELKKEKAKGQLQLDLFIKEEQADYIIEKIKVVEELKPYLEKTAKSLNLDGDIVEETEKLNTILSKRKIDWNGFEKVLKTKEKLITILIASLNSKYAKPLNDLLREITDLFNHKLDEKFAEEHNIKLEDLKQIKTFHWIFEFPEVFLDRGGFDVVVGNPPYLRAKDLHIKEKELFGHFYRSPFGSYDIFIIFIERGLTLTKKFGYFSLITSNKLLVANYAEKIREILSTETTLIELIDFSRIRSIFHGALISPSIFVLKKIRKKKYNIRIKSLKNEQDVKMLVNLPFVEKTKEALKKDIHQISTELESNIIEFIKRESTKLYSDKNIEVRTGIMGFEYWKFEEYIVEKNKEHKNGWCVATNGHLDRFQFRWGSPLRLYRKRYNKPYLLPSAKNILSKETSTTFSHVPKLIVRGIAKKVSAYLDNIGIAPLVAVHTIFVKKKQYTRKANFALLKNLLLLINSNLIDWYHKKEYYTARIPQGSLKYPVSFLKNLPILTTPDIFALIADYLLFLNATEKRRQKLKEIIEFSNRQIADFLVYELYFKEKFAEDGLYKEPKEYFLSAVSKHLKPINYNRWAEIYWKKQLEENLTKEEQKELGKLEKENMKTVEDVYKALKEEVKIKELIQKIKSHEWVKVIEGEV